MPSTKKMKEHKDHAIQDIKDVLVRFGFEPLHHPERISTHDLNVLITAIEVGHDHKKTERPKVERERAAASS